MAVATGSESFNPAMVAAARNIACATVVLAHANIYARPDGADWWPGGLFSIPLMSIVVPMFFALSGYFAVGTAPGLPLAPAVSQLPRRLIHLLPPFFFWNAVTILVLRWNGSDEPERDLIELLSGAWHLYYLFVLIQFECLVVWGLPRLRVSDLDRLLKLCALLSAGAYALADPCIVGRAAYSACEPWLRKASVTCRSFFSSVFGYAGDRTALQR